MIPHAPGIGQEAFSWYCLSTTTHHSRNGSSGSGGSPAPVAIPLPYKTAAPAAAPAPLLPSVSAADVAMLRELMPSASEAACAHALRQCGGAREEAVEMLFNRDLADLEKEASEALKKAEADQKREARLEKERRRATLERNDQVRDHRADGEELKLGKPRLPYNTSRKEALKGGPNGGVRYLDGQVVAHKGEKTIVVNEKEEWDGGSRGKVKTKGKRGPGFV